MIPKDKIYHFIAGAIIALITFIFFTIVGFTPKDAQVTAIAFSIIGGYFKEIYDEVKYKGFDIADWLATILGGLAMSIILILLF